MAGRYIDILVEEQEGIPDGCELRFHAVGESRPVKRVHYEPLSGPEGEYEVTAAGGEPALAAPVDDSGAGTSILIYGDGRGSGCGGSVPRRRRPIAEPYLLLPTTPSWLEADDAEAAGSAARSRPRADFPQPLRPNQPISGYARSGQLSTESRHGYFGSRRSHMEKLSVNGIDLAYQVRGDGPPLAHAAWVLRVSGDWVHLFDLDALASAGA